MVAHYDDGTLARLTYYFDRLKTWHQVGAA